MATSTPSVPVTEVDHAQLLAKVNALYESQVIILAKLLEIEKLLKLRPTESVEAESSKVLPKKSIADMLPKKVAKPVAKPAPVYEKKEKTPVDIDDGTLRIITNYTDKAVVLHGETASKQIEDDILKPLGFRFQLSFKYGPGWMIPASKLDEFMRKLTIYNKSHKSNPVIYEQVTREHMDELANQEKASVEEDLMTPAVPSKGRKTPSPSSGTGDDDDAVPAAVAKPVARTLKKKPVAVKRQQEESEEETGA